MRKRKSRAWDKVKKEMTYSSNQVIVCEYGIYDVYVGFGNVSLELKTPLNDLIIMLCAPLKDKNKKELYECDLVRDNHGNVGCICLGKYFDDNESHIGWHVRWLKHEVYTGDMESIVYVDTYESICPIFENPEYLTYFIKNII